MAKKKKKKSSKSQNILEEYNLLLNKAREVGKAGIRKSEYLTEISKQLSIYYGGKYASVLFVLTLILGLAIFGASSNDSFSANNQAIAVISSTFFGYFLLLWTVSATIADLWVFRRGPEHEAKIFGKVAVRTINPTTLLLSLVVIAISALATNRLAFYEISAFLSIFWVVTAVAILSSSLTLFVKLFRDLLRIVGSVFCSKDFVQYSTEELIDRLVKMLEGTPRLSKKINQWKQLAEMDMNRAESRIEFSNIAIAVFSILLAIFFSDSISEMVSATIPDFRDVIGGLIGQLSRLLLIGRDFKPVFELMLRVGIYASIFNGIVGLIIFSLGRLTLTYFQYYRPAYALKRALIVVSAEQEAS